ncbi:MAG: RrF2 family transcriptional regulator [Bacillota bacterium]
MKVSTRGRYGLRAMLDLAQTQSTGAIPLRKIADRQNISIQYLEQIFVTLRRAGLVKSVRGAHGGYKLNKSPDKIYIGDIIRALEGPIAPSECLVNDNCKERENCITRELWGEVKDSIENVLDSMTLEDLRKKSVKTEK